MATWDLFREMDRMRHEMDRMFSGGGTESWIFPFSRFSFLPGRSARTYPLINLSENTENLYVEALAPGIEPDSLQVQVVRGNQLSLSGAKNHNLDKTEPEYIHRNERSAGRFTRLIELPSPVEESKVKAEYREGLLTITMPKAQSAKARQIEVKMG